jgi:hypothetical protein
VYLGALAALDAGSIWFGSSDWIKYGRSLPLRMTGPALVGLTWGATVGGAWLALPKCSQTWVGEPPMEGDVRDTWPFAVSFGLLAAITAPIVNGIAVGSNLPLEWSTEERLGHVLLAGVAGLGGALLPYVLPPRTWRAAKEIYRLRLAGGGASAFLTWGGVF